MGNTCLYNALQRMVLPTTEQICCIVGNTPLYIHFQPKLPPTVNCRNVHELPGQPSYPKGLPFPPRQWHTQPSPNTPPRHISCSTPKEMLRMAHKTAFGGPAGQLWCAIVLESGKAERRERGKTQKRWPQDHLNYHFPDRNHREENTIRPIVSVILWDCGLQMPLWLFFLNMVANKAQK